MEKAIWPALIAFALQLIICPVMIPLLHKLKFGQYIREEGPKEHQKKAGTPTMGGIAILLTFTIGALCFMKGHVGTILPLVLLTWGMGLIGLADDLLKIIFKHNEGLKAWQKFGLQFIVAIGFVIYLAASKFGTEIQVPFGGTWNLKFFYYIFAVLLIVGFDNGANFTDGLDGLLTSVTLVIAAFLWVVSLMAGASVATASAAMIGSLLGFLCFNTNPAKVFMGDTGSLAIGGFVTGAALLLKIPLLLFLIGFIYLIEVLSVIIQVAYFKVTGGKRFFRMAPIHHHFELGGWKETKVVTIFTIVTAVLCLLSFLS